MKELFGCECFIFFLKWLGFKLLLKKTYRTRRIALTSLNCASVGVPVGRHGNPLYCHVVSSFQVDFHLQVSDFFGDTRSDRIRLSQDKTPALGLTWANTLTVRLMMSRTNESVTLPLGNSRESPSRPSTSGSAAVAHQVSAKTYQATVRALEVAFAPHLPNSVCRIVIDEEGVKGRA
jgi:hypothetical protein